MLRITRLEGDAATPCLRVEGRLVGDWVEVFETEVGEAAHEGKVALDLAGVDFADARALLVLRQLTERGAALLACSPLLLNLLGRSEP